MSIMVINQLLSYIISQETVFMSCSNIYLRNRISCPFENQLIFKSILNNYFFSQVSTYVTSIQ